MIEETTSCPLGHSCTSVIEGKLDRCAWHVRMRGKTATGDDTDEYRCAMAWMPVVQVEVAAAQRDVAAETRMFNKDMTDVGKASNLIMLQAVVNKAKIENG